MTVQPRNSRETREQSNARERRERIPLGVPRSRMAADTRPGYVRRWVNDTPGRIAAAEKAGYEHVTEGDQKRSINAGVNEDGSVMRAHLMEIPKEFYDEDQAAKQKPIDEFEEQLRRRVQSDPSSRNSADADKFHADVKIERS